MTKNYFNSLYGTLLVKTDEDIRKILIKQADTIDVGKGEVEYRFSEADIVTAVRNLSIYNLPKEPKL